MRTQCIVCTCLYKLQANWCWVYNACMMCYYIYTLNTKHISQSAHLSYHSCAGRIRSVFNRKFNENDLKFKWKRFFEPIWCFFPDLRYFLSDVSHRMSIRVKPACGRR